jgi:hypothetical protein
MSAFGFGSVHLGNDVFLSLANDGTFFVVKEDAAVPGRSLARVYQSDRTGTAATVSPDGRCVVVLHQGTQHRILVPQTMSVLHFFTTDKVLDYAWHPTLPATLYCLTVLGIEVFSILDTAENDTVNPVQSLTKEKFCSLNESRLPESEVMTSITTVSETFAMPAILLISFGRNVAATPFTTIVRSFELTADGKVITNHSDIQPVVRFNGECVVQSCSTLDRDSPTGNLGEMGFAAAMSVVSHDDLNDLFSLILLHSTGHLHIAYLSERTFRCPDTNRGPVVPSVVIRVFDAIPLSFRIHGAPVLGLSRIQTERNIVLVSLRNSDTGDEDHLEHALVVIPKLEGVPGEWRLGVPMTDGLSLPTLGEGSDGQRPPPPVVLRLPFPPVGFQLCLGSQHLLVTPIQPLPNASLKIFWWKIHNVVNQGLLATMGVKGAEPMLVGGSVNSSPSGNSEEQNLEMAALGGLSAGASSFFAGAVAHEQIATSSRSMELLRGRLTTKHTSQEQRKAKLLERLEAVKLRFVKAQQQLDTMDQSVTTAMLSHLEAQALVDLNSRLGALHDSLEQLSVKCPQ